jgi:CRP/FNR family transcriptional regulator, cyclic AMP receptor protein
MANVLGYAASCAVLATFLMRTMVPLRLVAILSNVLFLTYGYLLNIHPVFLLHMALLPINVWRLFVVPNAATSAQQPP